MTRSVAAIAIVVTTFVAGLTPAYGLDLFPFPFPDPIPQPIVPQPIGPAPSDACNQLAWAGDDGTTNNIYVANGDGYGRAEIVTPGASTDPLNNGTPVWSPDGSRIAWRGSDGITSQIWVADPDGSNRVEVSSIGTGIDPVWNGNPEWSPEGTRIAWIGYDERSDDTTSQIYVSAPDGTNRVLISAVAAGPDPVDNAYPAWSPDGTRIAWTVFDSTTSRIWVADADGSNRVEVTSVAAGTDRGSTTQPAWSPDGTRLAWTDWDATDMQIWVGDPDGSNRVEVSSVGTDTDPIRNLGPVWSPNGSRIAWQGEIGGFYEIWVADPDGSNRVEVSSVGTDTDPVDSSNPAWSPDGTRIAWQGWDGTTSQIYVSAADGTNRQEVSSADLGGDPVNNMEPAWRNWTSRLELTTTTADFEDGHTVIATATVTNWGSCPSTGIVVTGLSLACVVNPSVSTTAGSVANSTWTIPALAPGTTATATLVGTVSDGPCSSNLALTAIPAPPGRVLNATLGDIPARTCSTTLAAPFVDVSPTSFAAADIACIYALDITTGTSTYTYSPADNVTREQMAAFLARLWRALGQTCPTVAVPFVDVSPTSFAAADIACIYALDITTGTNAYSYSPADNVTREQMAAFLARLWRRA